MMMVLDVVRSLCRAQKKISKEASHIMLYVSGYDSDERYHPLSPSQNQIKTDLQK